MRPGNGVQHQVEGSRGRPERLWIGGNDEVVGAELSSGRLLLAVGRNGRHGVAHGLGELQAHLSEASEADDSNVEAALGGTEALERREHGDSGAEDGSGHLQRVGLGDLDQELPVAGDLVAEASVSVASVVRHHAGVLDGAASGVGVPVLADVLLEVGAGVAILAGVDVPADADMVSNLMKTHTMRVTMVVWPARESNFQVFNLTMFPQISLQSRIFRTRGTN